VLAALLPGAGCVSFLATAMYLATGNNTPAKYDGLKERRVAVVVRPYASLGMESATADRRLAEQISSRLREHVDDVDVIPQQDVQAWIDENSWDDYAQIGRALGAHAVVGVDLNHFHLYKGQTLYQGTAVYHIRVVDVAQGGAVVYEAEPPQSIYPPNTGIPTSEMRAGEFQREYIGVLAEEIGSHFYPHDRHAGFAADSSAIR
jgi:hypothetical protein